MRVEIPVGWTIHHAIDRAILMARAAEVPIQFGFNGIAVAVDRMSDPNAVLARFEEDRRRASGSMR